MFTNLSTALMIAALGLSAGLTDSAHAASQVPTFNSSDTVLAQFMPPVIPQLPAFPQQPPVLQPLPLPPILTPTFPVCPAPLPRPQIVHPAQPAVRAVAVTGDDDGCIPSHDTKHTRPTPHSGSDLAVA